MSPVPPAPVVTVTPNPVAQVTPKLSARDQRFADDLRRTFPVRPGELDSSLAARGEKVCSGSDAVAPMVDEAATRRHDWPDAPVGWVISVIVLAEKDLCPARLTASTVTYVVTGSTADVTYGPANSGYQGIVPLSVARPLASPECQTNRDSTRGWIDVNSAG
jgi:hypothetical protein